MTTKHTLTPIEKIRKFKKRQKQAGSKSPKSYDGITPRPWFNLGNTIVGGDANSRYKIAQTMKTVYRPERSVPIKEHEENAAHIVKCVNLFDEMVNFLEMINADMDGVEVNFTTNEVDQLGSILKRAKASL